VVLVDLDGDGRLDIAADNLENSSSFTIYQNLFPFGSPPVIITQPTNQTVVLGGSASFNVTATGALPLLYQWSFDGTNITGATNVFLNLNSVSLGNAGAYAVTISNPLGSTNSLPATLTVYAQTHFTWNTIPSPRFINQPFLVTIQARDALNNIVTNFTGTVTLSTTNGIGVTPIVTTAFVKGVWIGLLKVSQDATNLVLQATDQYGNSGLANSLNIVDLPVINYYLSGNVLLIVWPALPSGFFIETTDNLESGNWTPVTDRQVTIGNLIEMPVTLTQFNRFYRLHFPGP
jgi:hypothetical protein